MFNFAKETLDQMAFFIHKPITFARFKPIAARWNHRLHLFGFNGLNKRIGTVPLITKKSLCAFWR
jgi:hypothetical protein